MLRRLSIAMIPPVVAVLSVVVFGSLLILLLGQSPVEVGGEALGATLLSAQGFSEVLFRATPLILTGLAAAIPLAAGMFNIGGEGQLLMGAIACAWMAHAASSLGGLGMALSLVVAAAAGGLAGAVSGWLRHARQVNEVLSTIMLNFIYAALAGWLLHAHLEEPGTSHTPEIDGALLFTRMSVDGSLLSTSLLMALVMALAAQWLLFRSVVGLEFRVTGSSALTARHVGIHAAKMTIGAMALGGAMAGLAGAHLVLGARRFFEEGIGGGAGFIGIAVALMARGNPWAVIPSSLLFAVLNQAGLGMGTLVPRELVLVLQGLVVLCLGAALALMQRLPLRNVDLAKPVEAQRA